MSDYTKTTDFDVKDSLPSGDTGKIIRGSEFEVEFENIEVAIASKADSLNTVLTGNTSATNLSVTGNTTLGSDAADTVTVNADFSSDLLPSADATYDLGAVGSEWQDLYITGTANIDDLSCGTASFSGDLAVDTDTLFVDVSESKVGIGTSVPTAFLEVSGSTTSGGEDIIHWSNSANVNKGMLQLSTTGGGKITLRDAGNAEDVVIDSTGVSYFNGGNVGVGNASPTSRLTVEDETAILSVSSGGSSTLIIGSGQNSESSVQGIQFKDRFGTTGFPNGQIGAYVQMERQGTNARYDLTFGTISSSTEDAAERMRITDTGNVGIGTASPVANLDVEATSGDAVVRIAAASATNSDSILRFVENTTDRADVYWNGADNNFNISTTIGDILLSPTGNVGIGTDAPSAQLHLLKAGGTLIKLGTANNTSEIEAREVGGANSLVFSANNSTDDLVITGAGNVGIGTSSPSRHLDIEDTTSNPFISLVGSTTSVPGLLFGDTGSDSIGQIRYDNSDNSMEFTASNNMAIRIQSDGNVLIGKTVKQTQTSGLDVEQITATDGDGALGLKSGTSTTTGNAFINCFLQNGVGSGRIEANGANALGFGTFSDQNLKENIENLPPQLANVMQLRPVEFDYKDGSGHQIGFIAQEVEQVWPDLVSGEEGLKSIVGLGKTEARLIKALQEAVAKIELLEARIATLEAN